MELVEVIVVVAGQTGHPVAESQAAAAEMDTTALPFRCGQRLQERQHFRAPPPERREREAGIVADVLPLLDPSVGVLDDQELIAWLRTEQLLPPVQ